MKMLITTTIIISILITGRIITVVFFMRITINYCWRNFWTREEAWSCTSSGLLNRILRRLGGSKY